MIEKFFSIKQTILKRGYSTLLAVLVLPVMVFSQDMMPAATPGAESDTSHRLDTLIHGGIPAIRDTVVRPVNTGYEPGYDAGWLAGKQPDERQWFRTGCGCGTLVPIIGMAGAYVFARNAGDEPPTLPEGDSLYRQGFAHGYLAASRDKKGSAALTGGLIGTSVTVGAAALYFLVVRPLLNNIDWPEF